MMKLVRFLLPAACTLTLALVSHGVAAQEEPAPDADQSAEEPVTPSVTQNVYNAYLAGDYLGALRAFGKDDSLPEDRRLRSTYIQFRPNLDGFVVDAPPMEPNANGEWIEDRPREIPEETLACFTSADRRDAIATIVEHARDKRIVIINEAHNHPRDRAFVADVAEALAPLGFNHYAAETFNNWDTPETSAERMEALFQRGYVNFNDGYYSNGPGFAHALLRILEAGYRPVSYEWTPTPGELPDNSADIVALREGTEADNLAAAVAVAGPDAKFLIHVGYSHAAELPFDTGNKWMAARLKDLTGLDPLTIDQTDLSQYSVELRTVYQALAMEPGAPSVILFDDQGAVRLGDNAAERTDLQVIHAPIVPLNGRPDWLARTGRMALPVPDELMPQQGRALVQVFLDEAGDDAVPIDQMLVQAGDEVPALYVPTDRPYRLAVQRD